jgi:hypothetical protein
MQAIIAVGVERAVLAEHADLVPARRYDAAVAIRHFHRLGDEPFGHEGSPPVIAYPAALSVHGACVIIPTLQNGAPAATPCWSDTMARVAASENDIGREPTQSVSALAVGIAQAQR